MPGALRDVFVVDLSTGVAGGLATRLLADLGADVVKVEPPSGDTLRTMGPFPGDVPDPERSGLHLHLNANKRGVVLDVDDPADRDRLGGLLRRADIVVESFGAQHAADLGLVHDSLRAVNPKIVVASVTPFGRTGPYAGWRSDEVVEWAMGGWMQFVGDPEKHPLLMPGHQAALHAGQLTAAGALVAMREAQRTGAGQDVEVSHFESMALAHMVHLSSWLQDGRVVKRTGVNAVPTKDGHVEYTSAISWDMTLVLMDKAELLADEEWSTLRARARKVQEFTPMLREWTGAHSMDEVESQGQELRIPVTAARDIAYLVDGHPQMDARGFYLDLDHPGAGPVKHPGFPYKLSATPCEIRRPAPMLGEHMTEVLGEAGIASWPAPAAPWKHVHSGWHSMRPFADRDETLPLADLKVVEVTAYWAGPLAGRWMSNLGADVIKVEYADRLARRQRQQPGSPQAPPGDAAAPPAASEDDAAAPAAAARRQPYHRGHLNHEMNHGKRGIVLDLSVPEARETFLDLARWADVVVENNSARVMPNFGLGYEDLKKVNPKLIMVSISAFGATGPLRDYIAFGSNIEMSSGVFSQIGYGPGENWKTGSFYADPVGGNLATVAVLSALRHRDETGEGQYIDLSLNEASVGMFPEQVLEYTMNGRVRPPLGARSPRHAPQGVYRCSGEDSWMVLCVRDEAEWDALCRCIERQDLLARDDLRTVDGRRAAHDEIDEAIAAWAATRYHRDAAHLLQRAGIAAGPVLTNREMARDPHLFERGFCVLIPHPGLGVLPYPAWPWKLSRTLPSVHRHPPFLGEHNDEVFRDVLGYDAARIDVLYDSGATSFPDPGPLLRP